VLYPTEASAALAGMSMESFDDMVVAATMLDQPDPQSAWQDIYDRQQHLCRKFALASKIRFTTRRGTDLTMNVKGRRWLNGSGQCNLPDGEVFTAPIESSVNGTFIPDYPVVHMGHLIDGARFEFTDGRLVNVSADCGEAALHQMVSQDDGAARIGEVGLGLNPRITKGTGMSLIDEKMGGTFHIALGLAYPMTGGANVSVIHRDFIADLRKGGRIEFDHQVVNENGVFLPGLGYRSQH
jgi:aminopeptidase